MSRTTGLHRATSLLLAALAIGAPGPGFAQGTSSAPSDRPPASGHCGGRVPCIVYSPDSIYNAAGVPEIFQRLFAEGSVKPDPRAVDALVDRWKASGKGPLSVVVRPDPGRRPAEASAQVAARERNLKASLDRAIAAARLSTGKFRVTRELGSNALRTPMTRQADSPGPH